MRLSRRIVFILFMCKKPLKHFLLLSWRKARGSRYCLPINYRFRTKCYLGKVFFANNFVGRSCARVVTSSSSSRKSLYSAFSSGARRREKHENRNFWNGCVYAYVHIYINILICVKRIDMGVEPTKVLSIRGQRDAHTFLSIDSQNFNNAFSINLCFREFVCGSV